jgi:hypothetical protein
MNKQTLLALWLLIFFVACKKDGDTNAAVRTTTCDETHSIDQSRGVCSETLSDTPKFSESENGGIRTITANGIPDHKVGLFGGGIGSLNPNAISAQSEVYRVTLNPTQVNSFTALLSTSGNGPNVGPQYSFGILLNGVELDPIAAEPFPHTDRNAPNANWEWNLEATNVNLGLDCNNAHVQPNGKYHYHGKPTSYLSELNVTASAMSLIGYAADGFPIYYKYAYTDASNSNSAIIEMSSSYRLKQGERPGDGTTAPCGTYNGVYSNDYEFVSGLGTLDEANGREGITPEYPQGTYYYVLTDAFPSIPRYFRATPSDDFKMGG